MPHGCGFGGYFAQNKNASELFGQLMHFLFGSMSIVGVALKQNN